MIIQYPMSRILEDRKKRNQKAGERQEKRKEEQPKGSANHNCKYLFSGFELFHTCNNSIHILGHILNEFILRCLLFQQEY